MIETVPAPATFKMLEAFGPAIIRYIRGLVIDSISLPSYNVASLPPATQKGVLIYVNDEAGGAVVAFADGTDWRRVTDRAVVS
jgi:hypothetical protein